MSEQFLIRAYRPEDEDCVVVRWLKGLCKSEYGRVRGAHRHGTPERDAFWSEQRCTVMALVERCETRLIVDPKDEDSIWAFACTSPGVLHWVSTLADFTPTRRRALMSQFVDVHSDMLVTHEIPEVEVLIGFWPTCWTIDSRLITPSLLGYFR